MQGKYDVAISHRLLAVSSRSSESRNVANYTDYADYKKFLVVDVFNPSATVCL